MDGCITSRAGGRLSRRSGRRRRKTISPVEADPTVDWIEWGGQLIFAVDFTAGGAPIGPTWDEIEAMLELDSLERLGPPDWHDGPPSVRAMAGGSRPAPSAGPPRSPLSPGPTAPVGGS
jgi:hypothetical protein